MRIEQIVTIDRMCRGSTNVATNGSDRLAQWIARQTSNLKVAGSSPALVTSLSFWLLVIGICTIYRCICSADSCICRRAARSAAFACHIDLLIDLWHALHQVYHYYNKVPLQV